MHEAHFQTALIEARKKYPYINEETAHEVIDRLAAMYKDITERKKAAGVDGRINMRSIMKTVIDKIMRIEDMFQPAYRHLAGKYFALRKKYAAKQNAKESPAKQTKPKQQSPRKEKSGQYLLGI